MGCDHYRKAGSSQRERGFTLLELCMVVAVGIVISAAALPVINSTLAGAKVRTAASSISGAIQTSRYKSLSKGVPYQITLNKANGTYTVMMCSNCAATIYSPSSTFTYGADSSDPLTGTAIPFSSGTKGAALDSNRVLYFMPSGAVQWCADSTTTCTTPTTSCTPPISMTISYSGVSKTLTVTCYGQITSS